MVAVLKSPSDSLLEWVKVSDWMMVTTCGRFRCRKYYSGDVLNEPGPVRYQLFGSNGLTCGPPADSFAAIQVPASVAQEPK
jgi:hypothetical protein